MSTKELLEALADVKPHNGDNFSRRKFYDFFKGCGCPLTELAIQQDLMLRPIAYAETFPSVAQQRIAHQVLDTLAMHYNVTNNDLENVYQTFDANSIGDDAGVECLHQVLHILKERYHFDD